MMKGLGRLAPSIFPEKTQQQKAGLAIYLRGFPVHPRESSLPDPVSCPWQYSTSGASEEDGKNPYAMKYLAKYRFISLCNLGQ